MKNTKKTETKKADIKNKDYEPILNRIQIISSVGCVLLLAILIVNIYELKDTSRTYKLFSGETSSGENNTPADYDVSDFKSVTYKEFKEAIKSKDYTVVYIGRASCGYCVQFLPMLKQGQKEYDFTTVYFDITQVIDFTTGTVKDTTAYNEIVAIDNFFKDDFGSTPMVAVFKDGKYVNGVVGYTEYTEYDAFLKESGLTKK